MVTVTAADGAIIEVPENLVAALRLAHLTQPIDDGHVTRLLTALYKYNLVVVELAHKTSHEAVTMRTHVYALNAKHEAERALAAYLAGAGTG